MSKKTFPSVETSIEKIVGGGQSLGVMPDGRKLFVWGALPGERVVVQITKKKRSFCEGVALEIIQPSTERVEPRDVDSYISTSPWQIVEFSTEQHYKAALIEEAFELHDIVLPQPITVKTDSKIYEYRNKVEYSWYWDTEHEQLELAFFRRGTKGKIPISQMSLARPEIMTAARAIRDLLRAKPIEARNLKTLLVRCDNNGSVVWQLYVKDHLPAIISPEEASTLPAQGGEIIYSDPKSPASRITMRLASFGNVTLEDTILGVPFRYATEGFFQVNLPIYEQTLRDMKQWIDSAKSQKTVDLYSGVGTIGLTIGGEECTLVEVDEHAVREMRRNIEEQSSNALAVLAPSEKALEYITGDKTIIVDPPRAGLHSDVIERLRDTQPERIVYLSCNPVTQARDVALLCAEGLYGIRHHQGYNFFPRTPHIEHLVVLDKIAP